MPDPADSSALDSSMPHRGLRLAAFLIVSCVSSSGAAQLVSSPERVVDAALSQQLLPLIESSGCDVAVCVRDITNGLCFDYRSDRVMPADGLIRVPLLLEAYRQTDRGILSLDRVLRLKEVHKVFGSGILSRHFRDELQLSTADTLRLMTVHSDNTAANLIIDQVGFSSPNQTLAMLGFPNTRVLSGFPAGDISSSPDASLQSGVGTTTASEMTGLLESILLGEAASADACRSMLAHLMECRDEKRLAQLLPAEVPFSHLTAGDTASRCDVGILELPRSKIVICVLAAKQPDPDRTADQAFDALCGRIGRTVFDHFRYADPTEQLPVEVFPGDFGPAVEAVQRTLNARLDPSPQLSVDGDFGPATEAAVRRFRKQLNLPENGSADAEFINALGPLLTQDPPVRSPDAVNSETLPLLAPEDIQAPPAVSCDAWIVLDAVDGSSPAGHNRNARLPMASTTKLMTALLVLEYTAEHPEVLDETVTFSVRADRTRGSTAGIRAGESLPVRELMYGLLLPSGNDAATALAETFGGRLQPSGRTTQQDDDAIEDPVRLFVTAMNQRAEALGMTNTQFRNPHGLTEDGHFSSARDLAVLARHCLSVPLFRGYMAARQRGCTLSQDGTASRNVVWKNTNQLLQREGYSGMKTGTTADAGACLVASGARDGRELIVVILGAESSQARYRDARNLFRWAWQL